MVVLAVKTAPRSSTDRPEGLIGCSTSGCRRDSRLAPVPGAGRLMATASGMQGQFSLEYMGPVSFVKLTI